MVPNSILFFIMDYAYWRLLSKDFEPDNRPVHFRSSGDMKVMFIIDCLHKTIKHTFSF